MRGGGHDLVGLARVEATVIGGVGASDDGLGLQHLDRHGLARFRLHAADDVVLEGQRVDHEQAPACPPDLDGAGVVEVPEPHGGGGGGAGHPHALGAKRLAAQPAHLHPGAPLHDSYPRGPRAGEAPAREVLENQRPAADLDRACALGEGDADLSARPRRRRGEHEAQRRDRQRPKGAAQIDAAQIDAAQIDQRRPKNERIKVSRIETRMDVASGK
jgi:hypothetical protein